MRSSIHIDNNKKNKFALGRGPTQGLESTLTAEKCILLILQQQKRNVHYNGANSYLFVNGTEIYKF